MPPLPHDIEHIIVDYVWSRHTYILKLRLHIDLRMFFLKVYLRQCIYGLSLVFVPD